MSKTKITTPVPGFTGIGVAGLQFTDGVAHTDDEAIINYCQQAGYGVGTEDAAGQLDASELAELRRQSAILAPHLDPDVSDEDLQKFLDEQGITAAEVREALAEPIDPRILEDGGLVQVGTKLRDAAVDPQVGDFLPPTNAGQANPHGPLVVAPTIHGSGVKAVHPGNVHVDDNDHQEEQETAQADKTLVQQVPVHEALPTFEAGDDEHEGSDTGPLGLSDPGSVAQGVAAARAGEQPTYDPGKYGVDEVNSYLEEASDTERSRVLELEASGKARKGILEGPHGQRSDQD